MLKAGPHYGKGVERGYNTMKLALEDGAVIMSWGYVFPHRLPGISDLSLGRICQSGHGLNRTFDFLTSISTFINKVFNFIGIGIALYTVALVYGWASNDSVIKHTVKCKYCRKRISEKVRCSALL